MGENAKAPLTGRQVILITLTAISFVVSVVLAFPPSIPEKFVYLTLVVSAFLFFWSLWDITHSRMTSMFQKLDEHIMAVNIALALDESSRASKALFNLGKKHPIIKEYLEWFFRRHKTSLVLPSHGVIKALDADYFGFANLIFHQATDSVRSTSVVDPHWYDSNQCRRYIANQVEQLIQKGKSYTRYFIVNPKHDKPERKIKTVAVIKEQAKYGFKIVVVHTDNYEREKDAAVIDNGTLWVEADVPKSSHMNLPDPDIISCMCWFRKDSDHAMKISDLEGYFLGLDGRAYARFDSTNAETITEETVYGKT